MNIVTIMAGIFLVIFSIPSYNVVPSLITMTMNKISGGTVSPMASQIFSQLGIPPVDIITEYIQYGFEGCIVAGIGIVAFGIVQKKRKKISPVKLSVEASQNSQEEDANIKALHLLQERLVKGEITSSQYKDLRKLLED
jgi:hypothetical protein